jgi:glycosyltransferase involved in cell wall biosynthesis
MKIIAFYEDKYPNGYAPMVLRLHYYMLALKAAGVDVEIVMPDVCKSNYLEYFEGIPYRKVRSTSLNRFNHYKISKERSKICGELSSMCDVLLFVGERRILMIKKILNEVHQRNGKVVFEINENPYSGFKASRIHFKKIVEIQRNYFLKNLVPQMDGIIVISESLEKLFRQYSKKNSNIIKVPILTGKIDQKCNPNKHLAPYILHAGSFSEEKDGIKAMLNAFLIAHRKLDANLKFIFTSKKTEPNFIKWVDRFINENNLENHVVFKGLVSRNELETLYENCSLAIVNKPLNQKNNYNFPTKITELIPRSIPMILSRTGEINHYFTDEVNAYLVEPNNVNQISEKILTIINNRDKVETITENAKKLAEKEFKYLNFSKILKDFFEKIQNS